MKLRRELFLRCVLGLVATLSLAIFPADPAFGQVIPAKLASTGYSNGTPETSDTTAAFNSSGATTLVAFVSTNDPWLGLSVSISSVTDNVGNTWNVLTGPTEWTGSSGNTLESAIYYVNTPFTSATHTVTVNLSNPAPLVVNVFAVSKSDITAPPIFSAITNPGTLATSATVTTASISVLANSLLLSWVKNETAATATADTPYILDSSSTSFLWAETQADVTAGSYAGEFLYSTAIGWQAAIVGLQPLTVPVAYNQVVSTEQDVPVGITLTALSPQGLPLTYTVLTPPTNGTLSGVAPSLTYTPNSGYIGPDAFTFEANDGTKNTNVATIRIAVEGPAVVSSIGYINGTPETSGTTTAFNSSGATTLVAFVSTNDPWLGLPVSISGLTDNVGNTWKVLTGPTEWTGSSGNTLESAIYYVNAPVTSATHTVTVNLSNPAPLVADVFAVSGSDVAGTPISSPITPPPGFEGTLAAVTTAPISVPTNSLLLSWVKNESTATATADTPYTLDLTSTSFLWAETQTGVTAGSYTGEFLYSTAIGWQTAIVGLQPVAGSPGIYSPGNNSTLTANSATFQWYGVPGASAYWLVVGSTSGGDNYYSSGNLGNALTATVNGLPTNGNTLYVTLYALIGGAWVPHAYTYTALTAAAGGVITTPTPSSTLSGSSVTFDWTAGASASAYWLVVGSTSGGDNYYSSGNLGNSVLTATVYGLPTTGSPVYVTLYSLIAGAWVPNAYTYTAAASGAGLAVITSPGSGTTVTSNTPTFTWSAAVNASGYWLAVGSSPGGDNIYQHGVINALTFTLPTPLTGPYGWTYTGLPNDSTIYVTVYSDIGGQWFTTGTSSSYFVSISD